MSKTPSASLMMVSVARRSDVGKRHTIHLVTGRVVKSSPCRRLPDRKPGRCSDACCLVGRNPSSCLKSVGFADFSTLRADRGYPLNQVYSCEALERRCLLV